MLIKFYMSDMRVCGFLRGDCVARAVNQSFPNHIMDCKTEVLPSDMIKTNVMVFQRQISPASYAQMRYAQERGIVCLYDIDDDLLNVPRSFVSAFQFYSQPTARENLARFLSDSDGVICSTKILAASLFERFPKQSYYIVDNALWLDSYAPLCTELDTQPTRPTVSIGWMASKSHLDDAPEVGPALARLMAEFPNVVLSLIGWPNIDCFQCEALKAFASRITLQEWVDIGQLPRAMMSFDIGLAPLLDNPFNRAKTNIKFLHYGALGIPAVMTDIPPYHGTVEHGKEGLLVSPGDHDGWYVALKTLVSDPVKRRGMGSFAKLKVATQYNMNNNAVRWIQAFETARNRGHTNAKP